MEMHELVATWITYLRDQRVRVGSDDVMLIGPGARLAAQHSGASRLLLIEGLKYEASETGPAAWIPERSRVEEDAGRPLTEPEWQEFGSRLRAAIAMMSEEGMVG